VHSATKWVVCETENPEPFEKRISNENIAYNIGWILILKDPGSIFSSRFSIELF